MNFGLDLPGKREQSAKREMETREVNRFNR
jgi:hypothetical protein